MEFNIKTSKKDQIIDITDQINQIVGDSELDEGLCTVFVKHTTCALTTADLDPGTDLDLLAFLRKISPSITYKHPHDPSHAPDHLISSIIGPSINIPIKDSVLALGTWQKVILVELNGPKERKIEISLISAS